MTLRFTRLARRSRGRTLLALLCAGSALLVAQPAGADQITDKIAKDQQQQKQLNQAVARLQAQIAAAKNQEAQLEAIITGLNGQIQSTQNQIVAAQTQLATIQENIAITEHTLGLTRANLENQKRQLAQELVIIYETEQESTPLANLVASGDFNSFWRQVIDAQRIGALESRTVDTIHQEEASIASDLAQIQQQRDQQQQTLNTLNDTQQSLNAQLQARQQAAAYLAALQQQDQAKIAQINAAYNQLNNEIAQLQAEEAAALAAGGGNGHFIWPDDGPITQGFGCTQYTFEPYDASCPPPHHFHNGLDIAGPCGHAIWAADSGIAYIEPYQAYGFGNFVIIVHGNGWQTLYGHMASFAIHGGGQTVSRGQVIGYEGSTGNSTGCHLHFSVNHDNAWVNPLAYLS
ncbi:MAG TPA: peptidoglycan DD-metalloendopeptidase family protein [Candidatus Dormibacteraeota bacterium]|nr:peptidoglycan DD-metalloendopeptidase family protein [Candidatus Dormibacteraeota bacterium]